MNKDNNGIQYYPFGKDFDYKRYYSSLGDNFETDKYNKLYPKLGPYNDDSFENLKKYINLANNYYGYDLSKINGDVIYETIMQGVEASLIDTCIFNNLRKELYSNSSTNTELYYDFENFIENSPNILESNSDAVENWSIIENFIKATLDKVTKIQGELMGIYDKFLKFDFNRIRIHNIYRLSLTTKKLPYNNDLYFLATHRYINLLLIYLYSINYELVKLYECAKSEYIPLIIGDNGEKRFNKALSYYEKTLINFPNAIFFEGGIKVENDNLIVSKFGVFSVEVKNEGNSGKYEILIDETGQWFRICGNSITKINGHTEQVNRHIGLTQGLINDELRKRGINKFIKVNHILVIANDTLRINNKSLLKVFRVNDACLYMQDFPVILEDDIIKDICEIIDSRIVEPTCFPKKDYLEICDKILDTCEDIDLQIDYFNRIFESKDFITEVKNEHPCDIFLDDTWNNLPLFKKKEYIFTSNYEKYKIPSHFITELYVNYCRNIESLDFDYTNIFNIFHMPDKVFTKIPLEETLNYLYSININNSYDFFIYIKKRYDEELTTPTISAVPGGFELPLIKVKFLILFINKFTTRKMSFPFYNNIIEICDTRKITSLELYYKSYNVRAILNFIENCDSLLVLEDKDQKIDSFYSAEILLAENLKQYYKPKISDTKQERSTSFFNKLINTFKN